MFDRQTIKKAVEINLTQAIEACDMVQMDAEAKIFRTKLERITGSDGLSESAFIDLISEVRQSLEAIKFPQ